MVQRQKMSEEQIVRGLQQLADWDALPKVDDYLAAGSEPSIFRVLRLQREEGVHSDMLRWLLDPEGWHGLGAGFARRFLATCMTRAAEGSAASIGLPEAIEVQQVFREFSTGDGPVDILVKGLAGGAPLVLAIENKVDSPEELGQVARYASALGRRFRDHSLVVVLLSPNGRKPNRIPDSVAWSAVSYEHVKTALEEALLEVSTVQGPQPAGLAIARQYLSLVGRYIMAGPDYIDNVCKELLRKHPDAWRVIRSRMPSEMDELHQALGRACCAVFERECGGKWIFVVRRRMYAAVCRRSWMDLGDAPGDSRKYVSFGEDEGASLAAVHFRFALMPVEDDDAKFSLEVRMKVPGPKVVGQGKHDELLRALAATHVKLPDKEQYTAPLARRSRTEAGGEEGWEGMATWACKEAHIGVLTSAVDHVIETNE